MLVARSLCLAHSHHQTDARTFQLSFKIVFVSLAIRQPHNTTGSEALQDACVHSARALTVADICTVASLLSQCLFVGLFLCGVSEYSLADSVSQHAGQSYSYVRDTACLSNPIIDE